MVKEETKWEQQPSQQQLLRQVSLTSSTAAADRKSATNDDDRLVVHHALMILNNEGIVMHDNDMNLMNKELSLNRVPSSCAAIVESTESRHTKVPDIIELSMKEVDATDKITSNQCYSSSPSVCIKAGPFSSATTTSGNSSMVVASNTNLHEESSSFSGRNQSTLLFPSTQPKVEEQRALISPTIMETEQQNEKRGCPPSRNDDSSESSCDHHDCFIRRKRKRENDSASSSSVSSSIRSSFKSVRFCESHNQVINVPHVGNILEEQGESVDRYWMSEAEHESIKDRAKMLISIMNRHDRITAGGKSANNSRRWSYTDIRCATDDVLHVMPKNRMVCVRGLREMTTRRLRERLRYKTLQHNEVFKLQYELNTARSETASSAIATSSSSVSSSSSSSNLEEHIGCASSSSIVTPNSRDVQNELIREASLKYTKHTAKFARIVGISDAVNASSRSKLLPVLQHQR